MLFNLLEKNCMIGSISSRFRGMLSPGLLYLLTSTCSKTRLSLSIDVVVTEDRSDPAQTKIGVLHFSARIAALVLDKAAPILMIPPRVNDAGGQCTFTG